MNKKRLLCIILTLVAAISMITIRDSVAWINTRTGEPLREQLTIPKMGMDFSGHIRSCYKNENGEYFMISGQNLIWDNEGKITGVNYSGIQTELRVRGVYDTLTTKDVVSKNGAADMLVLTFSAGWSGPDANGYYTKTLSAGSTDGVKFDILNDIHFNDDDGNNGAFTIHDYIDSNGNPLISNVRIEIQAKQKDNMLWTDLDSIVAP